MTSSNGHISYPAPNALSRHQGAKNLDKGTGLWWRVRSGEHKRRDKEVLVLESSVEPADSGPSICNQAIRGRSDSVRFRSVQKRVLKPVFCFRTVIGLSFCKNTSCAMLAWHSWNSPRAHLVPVHLSRRPRSPLSILPKKPKEITP